MPRTGPISSCYECAGIHVCYGSKQPGISREQGRQAAAACNLPQKGRTTEVVRVVGRERGMSRKNAQELVDKGEAAWEGPSLVRFLVEKRLAGAALKAAKAARRAGAGAGDAEGPRSVVAAEASLRAPAVNARKPSRPRGRYRPGGVWRADDERPVRARAKQGEDG